MSDPYDLGTFFNEKTSELLQISSELKHEFLLEYNGFRKQAYVEGLQGVATMIHSLLFLEPGTYPDCPEIGIGIQNYQFELLNAATIGKLENHITEQINTYIPTIHLQNILIKKFENHSLRNTIGIGFEVSGIKSEKNNDTNKKEQFFLVLQELPDTREVLSQIMY